MSTRNLVWFVTGCSSGLGRVLTEELLSRGDKVIPTTRASSFAALASLQSHPSGNCHPLELEVTASPEAVAAVAEAAVAIWGRVDVVVNNAGFGFAGTMEENGVEGLMKQMGSNFFGAINVTNAFLPHMRSRSSGTVLFIGSRSAWRDRFPMLGFYTSSKSALRSASQAYAAELAQFNIRVLLIEPGGMQTQNWANVVHGIHDSSTPSQVSVSTSSPSASPATIHAISAYEPLRTSARAFMDAQRDSQPSSARKIARVLADVVRGEGLALTTITDEETGEVRKVERPWPEWLVLGADADADVRAKCATAVRLLDEWADVTLGVGIDEAEERA